MLQSPHFLYRVERGLPTANAQVLSLTSYELATRLSYFVWSSMPDQALFAAADDNQLATVNQLKAQAARMLDDPRAHAMVAKFHREWLRLDAVLQVTKSTALYPNGTPRSRPIWSPNRRPSSTRSSGATAASRRSSPRRTRT